VITSNPSIKRGEIWRVDLTTERLGHEIDKVRPAVIVSRNSVNLASRSLVVVVPITDAEGKLKSDNSVRFPNHILLEPDSSNGLTKRSVVQCEQVRAIDRARLLARLGVVRPQQLESIADGLCWTLDLFA